MGNRNILNIFKGCLMVCGVLFLIPLFFGLVCSIFFPSFFKDDVNKPKQEVTKSVIDSASANNSLIDTTAITIKQKRKHHKKKKKYIKAQVNNSSYTYNGHIIYTGKRGGQYYLSKSGNKVYI